MKIVITNNAKMIVKKFGFDEDEIIETIEEHEDFVKKDNFVLYKKNFNFWEYCYIVSGSINNEIIKVNSIRKIYRDLPSRELNLFSISPEEAWKQLHKDFGQNLPKDWNGPIKKYLKVVLKKNEYLEWLRENELK